MSKTIAIAGAGVLGRMLALAFHRAKWQVTIYDRDDERGTASCSWTGAGMIAPYCELEAAERIVTDLGVYSMEQWPVWLDSLAAPVFYRQRGSIVVAHPRDANELERLKNRVIENAPRDDLMEEVTGKEIAGLEPELTGRFHHALFFPFEQHLDNRDLMNALAKTMHAAGITWHSRTEITGLAPHHVTSSRGTEKYDWVIDARGLGAKSSYPDLRGIRGELIYLKAPEVNLTRPVRLMHPRYSIYIVPRADHVYVVGATAIESDSRHEITVRSALELLSAAYTVHTGFAEARFIEASVNCRPGFPNNLPRIIPQQGLMAINGLYRHGFLISPALVDIALTFINTGETHPMAEGILEEWTL
jgi:glycine oxidase